MISKDIYSTLNGYGSIGWTIRSRPEKRAFMCRNFILQYFPKALKSPNMRFSVATEKFHRNAQKFSVIQICAQSIRLMNDDLLEGKQIVWMKRSQMNEKLSITEGRDLFDATLEGRSTWGETFESLSEFMTEGLSLADNERTDVYVLVESIDD